mmetsp:Transcript_42209/g.119312  ORF Transcript_42209/g.119312 Transcript_42209/m.119312 type:complete len:238 (-) Transcript_42209:121-834(-)
MQGPPARGVEVVYVPVHPQRHYACAEQLHRHLCSRCPLGGPARLHQDGPHVQHRDPGRRIELFRLRRPQDSRWHVGWHICPRWHALRERRDELGPADLPRAHAGHAHRVRGSRLSDLLLLLRGGGQPQHARGRRHRRSARRHPHRREPDRQVARAPTAGRCLVHWCSAGLVRRRLDHQFYAAAEHLRGRQQLHVLGEGDLQFGALRDGVALHPLPRHGLHRRVVKRGALEGHFDRAV